MAKPGTRGDGALRRALELLKKVPLVDGHNDLPWVIRNDKIAQGDVLKYDLARRHNDGDTDIPSTAFLRIDSYDVRSASL